MIILGIETSCDETAASIAYGKNSRVKIISNIIASQINIHQKYGGVVPEIAAREHVINILPVIDEAFKSANIKPRQINAIAVTVGPGLITSLIVGTETARTLSYVWKKPIIPINHIEGHIYANFISENDEIKNFKFPAIILTVSGGHNLLVLMTNYGKFKIIGETLDDAAGEAFDKAAQILQLGYPGGPAIASEAAKFKFQKTNIILPRPMINKNNFDFSFSGLKTALLYLVQKDKNWKKRKIEYAYEFQKAVIDVLVTKTIKAAQKFQAQTIMLSGGVSANQLLRITMLDKIKNVFPKINFIIPDVKYTTDNAAMIAAAGYFNFQLKKPSLNNWRKILADANLELK